MSWMNANGNVCAGWQRAIVMTALGTTLLLACHVVEAPANSGDSQTTTTVTPPNPQPAPTGTVVTTTTTTTTPEPTSIATVAPAPTAPTSTSGHVTPRPTPTAPATAGTTAIPTATATATATATPPGPNDAQCRTPKPGADFTCLQNCGPPVARPNDPEPGWDWFRGRRRPCPICLPAEARIATPDGEVAVSALREGMSVWTTNRNGDRVAGVVARAAKVVVPRDHRVARVRLSDGRVVTASPGHPTSDGRALGELVAGQRLDGAVVVSVESVAFDARPATLGPLDVTRTYDILPSGETGAYWADGVLIGSTLREDR